MADENNKRNETSRQQYTPADVNVEQAGMDEPEASHNKETSEEPERKKSGVPPWLYVLYKIFRILLVPILCLLALYIGLRIGYTTFGGGDSSDVLDPSTWTHLFDLIFKD